MNDFLYKLLPMILSLLISQIIYMKSDKKYDITNKISLKLHIKQEWMAVLFFCFIFVIMFIIGILNIYVLNIPSAVYFTLGGILTGIAVGMKHTK